MNRILLTPILLILIAAGAYMFFINPAKAPTNGNDSPAAQGWVTEKGNPDILRNISVKPGDTISSPITITGEARGNWYFEASFPITLVDWDGRIIAQVPAQAQGEWMTTEYVPFSATLTFENPSWDADFSKRGAVILQKDNASGLPEHDDSLEIFVVFE